MKQNTPRRRALLIALAVCAVLILPLAVSGSGLTDSDPLISLGYLTGTYQKQIAAETEAQISSQRESLEKTLDERISGVQTAATAAKTPAPTHTTVNVPAGSSYTVPEGAEFLFLSGGANVTGAGLTDVTSGESVAASDPLTENHLYVAGVSVTIRSGDGGKLLIRK